MENGRYKYLNEKENSLIVRLEQELELLKEQSDEVIRVIRTEINAGNI